MGQIMPRCRSCRQYPVDSFGDICEYCAKSDPNTDLMDLTEQDIRRLRDGGDDD